jgi:anti-sigma regulatory factor (Ser/Thr protein kinase)
VTGRLSPTDQQTGVERVELAAQPASVAAARRLVRAFAIRHRLPDDVADSMCLTASELVTNSVLHARTPLTLTLHLRPGVVRIGVGDRFPATPAVRHYRPEALTGRGLGVIAALSHAWGVDADHDGKLVWAEISLDDAAGTGPDTLPQTSGPRPDPAPPGTAAMRTARFPGVPVATYLALQEHNDALYRELELLAIEHDTSPPDVAASRPPRLRALARELLGPELRDARNAHREVVAAAQARGEATVDLQARAPVEAVPLARAYVALLDEADAFGSEGLLLTTPPDPRVTKLRHWFVEQFAAQLLDGQPATPPAF